MKSFIGFVGRGVQILGLVQVAASLWIGVQTDDPRLELKLLLLGVLEFLAGYVLLKLSEAKTA